VTAAKLLNPSPPFVNIPPSQVLLGQEKSSTASSSIHWEPPTPHFHHCLFFCTLSL
jgi:hypothetical protein